MTRATRMTPGKSRSEAKADETTRAARDIQDADVSARDAKTARLKAARLAMEENQPPVEKAKGGKGFTKAPKELK
jgi:hypothetical protein